MELLRHSFLILIFLCSLSYYNSFKCGFVFDDISAIRDNKDITPNVPVINLFKNDFWGTKITKEQSHKSYRPLTVLTFRVNYLFGKLDPFGYHFVNMLLHTGVCLLFEKILSFFLSKEISFISSVLFAVHPVHTEAVTGVVGRAELLSSLLSLLTFFVYDRVIKSNNSFISMILFSTGLLCAILCKEQGITISGICIVYEIFIVQSVHILQCLNDIKAAYSKKQLWKLIKRIFRSNAFKRIFFVVGLTFILFFGRVSIMGSQLPIFTKFDNPASASSFPARHLTYNYLIFVNIMLLFYPSNLCCDWTMGTIPIIEEFYDFRNLYTILCYAILITLAVIIIIHGDSSHSKVLIMGFAFLILPFIPASNLFFPVGFVVAERILYMPSMGFCILIAYGYSLIMKKFKNKIIVILLVALICSHGIKTYHRNLDWETEYSIFSSGIRVNKNNAKLFNNVGHSLENKGQYLDALSYFLKAADIQKDDIGAHINVGRAYKSMKMYDKAEETYNIAKSLLPKPKQGEIYHARVAPNHLSVFINLASLISLNESRLEEADLLYRQAISMRSDYVQAYINRGDVLMKLNRPQEAQQVYQEALAYDNDNPDLYYNLGVVLLNQNETKKALEQFEIALKFNPDHEQSLFNSAVLLQEMYDPKYRQPAEDRLLKLLKSNDNNDRVLFNLGMLSMDQNKTADAVMYFKRAIEIKKDFRSALFNLGLLLADSNRPAEAIPYLDQLMFYYPDHIKGLILLGDIYVNHVKNLTAAELCYRKILSYEPENIQGLHNLCVVYVERKELLKAIKCLEKAHELAPNEEYILRHLNIVKSKIKET